MNHQCQFLIWLENFHSIFNFKNITASVLAVLPTLWQQYFCHCPERVTSVEPDIRNLLLKLIYKLHAPANCTKKHLTNAGILTTKFHFSYSYMAFRYLTLVASYDFKTSACKPDPDNTTDGHRNIMEYHEYWPHFLRNHSPVSQWSRHCFLFVFFT
jgi:hypothetical protein